MNRVIEQNDVFLAHFEQLERQLCGHSPRWLNRLRKAAIAQFAETGLPGTKHEEWRFTDVSPIAEVPFEPAGPESGEFVRQLPERIASSSQGGHRIVCVNGSYSAELSDVGRLPQGVVAGSLADALCTRPQELQPHLGRHASYREHPFTALNTALMHDGVLVHVPRGVAVEEPIYLFHLSTAPQQPVVAHPRNLFLLDELAEATIVETHLGLDESLYFTNAVSEIVLAEGAVVDHYKVQRESRQAFHIGTVQAYQGRDSRFSSHWISLGGALVRNETNVVLGAEGCRCMLGGLYLAAGDQHVDSRTRIDHAQPHCNSHELYKGILDGHARGVFNGKIYVHPDAQKTDAKQINQALLLSDDACVDTKPQLEIFADDVKCTHGATVGQLDEEALFYLRSRGISHRDARNLLIYAFANDLVDRIRVDSVRAELERVLLARHGLPADWAYPEAS